MRIPPLGKTFDERLTGLTFADLAFSRGSKARRGVIRLPHLDPSLYLVCIISYVNVTDRNFQLGATAQGSEVGSPPNGPNGFQGRSTGSRPTSRRY